LLFEAEMMLHAAMIASVALVGCATPSALGEASLGPVHPLGDALASDGIQLRLAAGIEGGAKNRGKGMHLTYRSAGITSELALGLHAYALGSITKHTAMFVRVGVNLIEWDRVGTDDGAGLAGPSFEVGIGSNRSGSVCVVASAARDLRFDDRDDTFLGVSLGMCAIIPSGRL
jgi:hypothetical protein